MKEILIAALSEIYDFETNVKERARKELKTEADHLRFQNICDYIDETKKLLLGQLDKISSL